MDPLELVSLQLTVGEIHPEELPMLAADALAEGRDSPALREAAGEPLTGLDKVRSTFRQAMSELGYREFTKEEAWWKLAHWKAAQIVAGEVEEYEGARWLGYRARDGLRYAGDYSFLPASNLVGKVIAGEGNFTQTTSLRRPVNC